MGSVCGRLTSRTLQDGADDDNRDCSDCYPRGHSLLLRFLRLLAEFDGHPESLTAQPEDLDRHMFGTTRCCHAIIAEQDGEPIAFATYHFTFSTFSARPGLWLDDLFVLEAQRGAGVGTVLLTHLCSITLEEGCCRLNWIVNQANDRGVAFYERIGAEVLHDYRLCRMDEDAMAAFLGADRKRYL